MARGQVPAQFFDHCSSTGQHASQAAWNCSRGRAGSIVPRALARNISAFPSSRQAWRRSRRDCKRAGRVVAGDEARVDERQPGELVEHPPQQLGTLQAGGDKADVHVAVRRRFRAVRPSSRFSSPARARKSCGRAVGRNLQRRIDAVKVRTVPVVVVVAQPWISPFGQGAVPVDA